MSRWADAFAELSGGSDTFDRIRHSDNPPAKVSQSVNSVTVVARASRQCPVPIALLRAEARLRPSALRSPNTMAISHATGQQVSPDLILTAHRPA
jgi:hypothetical protein